MAFDHRSHNLRVTEPRRSDSWRAVRPVAVARHRMNASHSVRMTIPAQRLLLGLPFESAACALRSRTRCSGPCCSRLRRLTESPTWMSEIVESPGCQSCWPTSTTARRPEGLGVGPAGVMVRAGRAALDAEQAAVTGRSLILLAARQVGLPGMARRQGGSRAEKRQRPLSRSCGFGNTAGILEGVSNVWKGMDPNRVFDNRGCRRGPCGSARATDPGWDRPRHRMLCAELPERADVVAFSSCPRPRPALGDTVEFHSLGPGRATLALRDVESLSPSPHRSRCRRVPHAEPGGSPRHRAARRDDQRRRVPPPSRGLLPARRPLPRTSDLADHTTRSDRDHRAVGVHGRGARREGFDRARIHRGPAHGPPAGGSSRGGDVRSAAGARCPRSVSPDRGDGGATRKDLATVVNTFTRARPWAEFSLVVAGPHGWLTPAPRESWSGRGLSSSDASPMPSSMRSTAGRRWSCPRRATRASA